MSERYRTRLENEAALVKLLETFDEDSCVYALSGGYPLMVEVMRQNGRVTIRQID
jgi:hypothetical protein